MENPTFIYSLNGNQYNVFVTKKRFQQNIYYRYKADGFFISCPKHCSDSKIVEGLNKFAPKLLSKFSAMNTNYSFDENYVFLLGEKYEISSLNIQNIGELQRFLKKIALQEITKIVREKEQEMSIKTPYKVSVRNMSTRLGSNSSKTHRVTFQIALIHYSKEIIESVVVHELAHHFYMNHSQKFYVVVFKHCPNYKETQRKLKKGIHK